MSTSGIYNFNLHDQNDWVYINEYTCKSIRGDLGDADSYCFTTPNISPVPPLLNPEGE